MCLSECRGTGTKSVGWDIRSVIERLKLARQGTWDRGRNGDYQTSGRDEVFQIGKRYGFEIWNAVIAYPMHISRHNIRAVSQVAANEKVVVL